MGAFLRKYGTGTGADIYVPIVKRGVVDFAVSADWTPAAGDVKVSKDGGTAANIGTLPTAVTMGNTAMWKFVLSDSELQCKFLSITVADSATKVIEDQMIVVETYGNASAMYQADLSAANLPANVTQLLGTAWLTPATAGTPDVNAKLIGGTVQTAGDISARLPAALTSNGNMKSSLLEIISTALTEGATGRIAAAWQAAWNVISPVWTAQSVNQSGDVYPLVDTEIAAVLAAVDTEVAAIKAKTDNLPSDPADASDITAAHAATDAEIAKIPKSDGAVGWNATARAQIQAEAEDALAAFWVIATGTIDNTGATQVTFRTDLTAPNSTYNDLQLEITSGTLAGQTKVILTYLQANGQITLSEALTEAPANGVTFRIKKIHTRPVASIQQGLATAGEQAAQTTLLNTIVGYLDTEVAAILAAVDTEVAAIKAKTDNLPSDPADQSAVEAAILAFGTTPMSYSARATGAMPTRDQLMLELLAGLLMHETSGLIKTLKKPDGTSSTKTYQFDADPPTSIQELT